METRSTSLISQNRVIVWIALATSLALLVPLLAMQVTGEVAWTLLDFVAAGSLLFGTGLMFVLAARTTRNIQHKVVIGVVFAAALMYVWAELAVGVFTNLGS